VVGHVGLHDVDGIVRREGRSLVFLSMAGASLGINQKWKNNDVILTAAADRRKLATWRCRGLNPALVFRPLWAPARSGETSHHIPNEAAEEPRTVASHTTIMQHWTVCSEIEHGVQTAMDANQRRYLANRKQSPINVGASAAP
jgi:hypothetical protein